MAEGVVDPLEIVQIHHGQAERLMLEQQTIDAFVEETAVVEAGQLVEVGLLARLVIILAHLRQLGIDVSELAHPLRHVIGLHPTRPDHAGDLVEHAAKIAGPDQRQHHVEHAGQRHHQLHVEETRSTTAITLAAGCTLISTQLRSGSLL